MRSKFVFFLLFLSIVAYSLKAQQFQADFSDKYGMIPGVKNAVPAKDGWLVIKQSYDRTKLYQDVSILKLLLVNSKMEKLKEVEIPTTNNKFIHIEGLFKANGTIVLVYAHKLNRADKEYLIVAKKINETDLTTGPEINLGSYETKYGNNTPDFTFQYSIDSSKYFLFTEPIQKAKDNKQFHFKVLNNDLSIVNQKTIELDAQSRFVKINSTSMDNHANVYVEYRVYEKDVENDRFFDEDGKIPDYQSFIIKYSKDGKQLELTPNLDGNFLHTARLMADKNGQLHIAGTYKFEKKGRLKGVFYSSYDPASNKTTAVKMNEIPADILSLLDNDGFAKKDGKKVGISANFNPKSFLERGNGTFDFTLEYNSIEEGTSQGSRGSIIIDYTFISGAILNVNIAKNGNMQFVRIPKKQKSEGGWANLSNYSFSAGNKLIFLYNDNNDNAERDISKKPESVENFRKSALMAAVIDEKGNVNRQIVYEHSDDKFVSHVNSIKRASANSFFIVKRKTGSVLNIENSKFGILTISKL